MGGDWTTTTSGKMFGNPELWVSHQDLQQMIGGKTEVADHQGVRAYVRWRRESIKSLAEQKASQMADLITDEERKEITPEPPGSSTSPFWASLFRPRRII